jgi:16S rRNA (guanine527-N7)-methyltransferase
MDQVESAEFEAALEAALSAISVSVEAGRRERMRAHLQLVVEANRQFNLTRITSPAEAAVKHYADSLALLGTGWVDANGKLAVLDVGTGAGFPAVPLAIACPNWRVTAIDGTGKKVRFVDEAAATLGLTNVKARHARAADLVRQGGGRFDLVLVRAVGQIGDLLAEVVPLLTSGGAVVFYKTVHLEADEITGAERAAARLGLRSDTHGVDLPLGGEVLSRQLIRYCRG